MINHSMPTVGLKECFAVSRVIRSRHISRGKQVERFERELARFVGLKYGAAVSSGTAALYTALKALGIKQGHQVILPSFCCAAVLQAVNHTGADAVITDISLDDYNLSFSQAQKKINRKTKAIVLPHMFGCPADIRLFMGLPVPVIEDCAQVLGAHAYGSMAGSFGAASIFSFYATKLITSAGEGGMVIANNRRIVEAVKDMRVCDVKKNLNGNFNYKMTDIQAAMGTIQLHCLSRFIAKRKKIAQRYSQAFGIRERFIIPKIFQDREHIYFRYIIRTPQTASKMVLHYRKRGIEAALPVPMPLHRIMGLSKKHFPHTEEAFRHAVSLPIYPSLGNRSIQEIIDATEQIKRI